MEWLILAVPLIAAIVRAFAHAAVDKHYAQAQMDEAFARDERIAAEREQAEITRRAKRALLVERFRAKPLPDPARLRQRLRLVLVDAADRDPVEGLVMLERPLAGGRYGLRVSYPDEALPRGITREMRESIYGDDDTLWDEVLCATLPDLEAPVDRVWYSLAAERVATKRPVEEGLPLRGPDAMALAWLARPDEALPPVGSAGALVAADLDGFFVVPVPAGRTQAELLRYVLLNTEARSLLFFWDGARLYDVGRI